jgi:6-pyruvoyltetrahydropterin/6-carboxytetrahydropterin synthase
MASSLSRVVGFRSRHRLYRSDWSEAQNREAFGPLADPAGHEHDYRCVVTVAGPLDRLHGMVMDLVDLDALLAREVVAPLAGKYVNREVPEFADGRLQPTCEALAAWVFRRIAGRLPEGVALERVRILEDPSLYGDCTGVP